MSKIGDGCFNIFWLNVKEPKDQYIINIKYGLWEICEKYR